MDDQPARTLCPLLAEYCRADSGITGRVTLILTRAAEIAIRRGSELINADWIDRASRDLDLGPRRVA